MTSAAMPSAGAPQSKREAIVEALLRLASNRPWNDIEIVDIAREANVSLSEFRDLYPSNGAVLGGYSRMVDRIVLDGTTNDLADEPPRDRVFDVMMRRLDAMAPHKEALRRITWAMKRDPLSLAALNQVAVNSMRFMLAAASVTTEGPLGHLKVQGAVVVFANTMETWLDDDDPALARTMARLDRELRRGERVLGHAEDFRRLTAPFRALGQALVDGRNRMRHRRPRSDWDRDDGDTRDPAAAI